MTATTITTTTTATTAATSTEAGPAAQRLPNPATDLFTSVHKGLRHGLFHAVEVLGTTDWTDPASAVRATATWAELDTQLRSHAHHEDAFIFPLLEARRPGAWALLHGEHRDLEALQDEVGAAVAAAAGDASGGLSAYRLAGRFASAYLAHLLVEEQEVMPALWACCTDEELLACRAAFLATVPPVEAAVTQRWVLRAIDRSTRAGLLRAARASLPEPVFTALLALAHQVLPADERAHLDAALAA